MYDTLALFNSFMAEMQKEHSGNHQADEDTAAVDRAIVAYDADTRAHR